MAHANKIIEIPYTNDANQGSVSATKTGPKLVESKTGNNDIIIEAWNTVLFDKYLRFKHLFTEGLASHSEQVLQRQAYQPGMKILDVGCGFGDSTIEIAKRVGPKGQAVGIDCAENFIQACWADVSLDYLGGPYDEVFARFGTMFFNLPGAR